MQVFTPAQAKSAAEERTAKDALRAKGLAEITKELLKEQEKAERDFEQTLRQQREAMSIFMEESRIKKDALEKEVVRLEDRRKKALIPPLIKAEDIHSVQEELHARKLVLDLQESEQEESSRLLMRRLDELSTQKQDLDSREQRVKRMELGAETQKNQVAESAKLLGRQIAEFTQRAEEKELEFAHKQSELDATANLQSEIDRGFIKREEEIQASMRLLDDQRILLQKGFNELRKK